MPRALPIAAAIALFAALPAHAATIYDCSMNVSRDDAWVQPKIALVLDNSGQSVKVSDPIIRGVTGKDWIDGNLEKSVAGQMRVTWAVKTESSTNQRTTMDYTAQIDLAAQTIGVYARPRGFDNSFFFKGTCAVSKVK